MDIFSRNIDSVSAIFSANHVIKYPDENYYKAVGDVILLNINTNDGSFRKSLPISYAKINRARIRKNFTWCSIL